MDYVKIYESIVNNAKLRNSEKGGELVLERHHIVPKSCGGDDSKNNLVNLTLREHFICHVLLTKIYKNTEYHHKMLRAAFMMTRGGNINSRLYLNIKEAHIKNLRLQIIPESQRIATRIANKGNTARKGKKNGANWHNAMKEKNERIRRGELKDSEIAGREKIAIKNRERCKGKKPPNVAILTFEGITYTGWNELEVATGVSRYKYINVYNLPYSYAYSGE